MADGILMPPGEKEWTELVKETDNVTTHHYIDWTIYTEFLVTFTIGNAASFWGYIPKQLATLKRNRIGTATTYGEAIFISGENNDIATAYDSGSYSNCYVTVYGR